MATTVEEALAGARAISDDQDSECDHALPLANPAPDDPLLTSQFATIEALEEQLHDFAARAGFSIHRLRVSNKVTGFGYSRIDYACSQNKIQQSKARSRDTSTIKRNCEWQATANALASNGRRWTFEIRPVFGTHNHETGVVKRRFSEEHKAFIASFADRPAIKNREIAASLRERFPGIIFTRQQLKNTRQRLRILLLDGYTPFQATMKLLDERGTHYTVLWADEDQTKPQGLFWSPDWCAQEWKKSSRVQMYDNTYRTNNKGLALFQIIGLNGLGKSFSCGFGLINNEREEGFNWVLKQVDYLRSSIGASAPEITITDYDKAMKNAVKRVYPNAMPQICIFHVNKNVVLHIKKKWDKKAAEAIRCAFESAQGSHEAQLGGQDSQEDDEELDEEDERVMRRLNRMAIDPHHQESIPTDPELIEHSRAGLYALWGHVLYAITLEGFHEAWERLKAFFSEQTAIIEYLETTYMAIAPEWATCYVNQRRNFGQRTTSPVEATNRYIKSYVINGNSTVLQVVEQSFKMVDSMAEQIKDERRKQQTSIKYDFLGKYWLGDAPYYVAAKALKMVRDQYRRALSAIPTRERPNPAPLAPCTTKFTAQFGIPCSHRLLEKYQDGDLRLQKLDFDPF